MIELAPSVKAAAAAHAAAEFPRESCGLAVVFNGRQMYAECRNIAEGTEQFAIHPDDYAGAEEVGEIVAVIHSHPNASAQPSQADIVSCEASGLPWHIIGYPSGVWCSVEPSGYKAPLVGREFVHGVMDCYTLIRDYYAQVLSIELPDFERRDNWWHKGQDLYRQNFEKAGFVVVDDGMRQHDVLLMSVLSPVPNHGGVVVEDNVILHHLWGRLSSRDVFGGYYRKNLTHVLRHKTLL